HHRAEESFYHSALHAYCWGILEIPPLSEPPGGEGTPDIILLFNDGLYVVIELKYQESFGLENRDQDAAELKAVLANLANQALKAIDAKKYANPYLSRAQKIIKIGLGVRHREECLALIKIES
ncbi:MAG: PD-(D/E)XK nuclease domain-containing protein, partial [Deltaproteobacteria bacterium]|nr:PD-(D/E)XK nuclease domain-containing protein [Deltaproteobacteria bacterium]